VCICLTIMHTVVQHTYIVRSCVDHPVFTEYQSFSKKKVTQSFMCDVTGSSCGGCCCQAKVITVDYRPDFKLGRQPCQGDGVFKERFAGWFASIYALCCLLLLVSFECGQVILSTHCSVCCICTLFARLQGGIHCEPPFRHPPKQHL
jgi:hypothetical protein